MDEVHRPLRGLLRCLAVLNEFVWRVYGTDTWVNFRTFVLPAANFLFIMVQVPLFQRYAIQESPGQLRAP